MYHYGKSFIIKKKTLPVQLVPSPVNPLLQAHVKLPGVFVQAALASQLVEHDEEHSLTPAIWILK